MRIQTDNSKPICLNEWAYRSIRSRIVNNELPVGTQIEIQTLAAEMGISRTPIREAIIRLIQDGFIRSVPCVGYFVRGISRREFLEVYELRTIIDAYAAERAAISMDGATVDALEAIANESLALCDAGSRREYYQQVDRFHFAIVDHLQNERLSTMRRDIAEQIHRFRSTAEEEVPFRNAAMNKAIDEHLAVLTAIRSGEGQRAREAMLNHLTNNRAFLIERIRFEDDEA